MVKILIEKEEALRRYDQLMIGTRIPAIVAFLFATLILKVFFQIPFPNLLLFLVSFMALSTVIYDFLFRKIIKNPNASQIVHAYFFYYLLDLPILTIIIYIIGGVMWIGFIFYSLYIYLAFLILPRSYALFLVFWCSFLYTLLVIIQYFEVFPPQFIFTLKERTSQNFPYVFSTWMVAIIFLWVLGYYGDVFYKLLSGKIEELQKARARLDEERASLEIRVRARTREFWEERKGLQGKIRERTKELEKERGQLTKKIAELEKFYKLAVGRELKMKELKREIERLKKIQTK